MTSKRRCTNGLLSSCQARQLLACFGLALGCEPHATKTIEPGPASDVNAHARAPSSSPAVVTVLDPGAEPRTLLRLKPQLGREEEVELAYRGETLVQTRGEKLPQTEAARALLNLQTERTDARGTFEGGFLIAALRAGSRFPCGEVASGPADGTVVEPTAVIDPTSPCASPGPLVRGTFRVTERGRFEVVDLTLPNPDDRMSGTGSQALSLAWPLPLPSTPVGIGARWRSEETTVEGSLASKTVILSELLAFDGTRGTLKVRMESTLPRGELDDPVLGRATFRDYRQQIDRHITFDLTRLSWPSSSRVATSLEFVVPDAASRRVQYITDVSVEDVGARTLGIITRFERPDPALARAVPPPCRTLRGGKSEDIIIAYPDGGERTTGSCRNGQAEGRWQWWHRNGRLELEATFDSGLPDGSWRQWNDSGRQLGEYRFSRGTGTAILWAADGTKQAEVSLRRGVQHGRYAAWHPNGKPAVAGEFQEGVANGIWTQWDEGGGMTRREDRDPRCLIVLTPWENGVAAKAGILSGDRIIALDGVEIASTRHLRDTVQAALGRRGTIRVLRDGRPRDVQVKPLADDSGQARLGVGLGCCHVQVPRDAQECSWIE